MVMAQPVQVHLTPPGPNSWKVVFVLEELGVPYDLRSFKFDHVKQKPFIDLNPNGRVPAIEDPNTNITLWESGAIIQYLVELYDTDRHLTYDGLKDRHHVSQWLHFQMSGQGPYYGVAGWFNNNHPEKVSSAIDRYNQQARRVLEVLDGWLQDKDWLVGDKMTYADMAFVPWNERFDMVISAPAEHKFDGFQNVKAWHNRMTALPSWQRAMEHRDRLMDEQGLQLNGMPKGINNMAEYEAKMKRDAREAATSK